MCLISGAECYAGTENWHKAVRNRAFSARYRLLDRDVSLSRTCQPRLCMTLHDEEAARNLLELALASWEPQRCWLEVDPRFDNLGGSMSYKDAMGAFKITANELYAFSAKS